MNPHDHAQLGFIQKPQGTNGGVTLRLNDGIPPLRNLKTLFIQINNTLVPYFVETFASTTNHKAIIKLRGVDSRGQADALRGLPVFVPYEALPKRLQSTLAPTNVVGYQVIEVQKGALGKVHTIYQTPLQSLLALYYQGQELLIPYQ